MSSGKILINGRRVSLADLLALDPHNIRSLEMHNLPCVTALPALPAAAYVEINNLPGVTVLPDLPAAARVELYNLPGVTALPALTAATEVRIYDLPGVTALPDMPAATRVWLDKHLSSIKKATK